MQRPLQNNSNNNRTFALPILLDQKQLAEYLGKSQAWCERARWAGEGPKFIKLGRHVRYRVEDVAAWIENQSEVGAE
jgi:predicted DNA-binding transcriptional regulator AlpA